MLRPSGQSSVCAELTAAFIEALRVTQHVPPCICAGPSSAVGRVCWLRHAFHLRRFLEGRLHRTVRLGGQSMKTEDAVRVDAVNAGIPESLRTARESAGVEDEPSSNATECGVPQQNK